jgi:hypothetical protein
MTSKLLYFFCGLLICASVTIAADIPEYPFVFVVAARTWRYRNRPWATSRKRAKSLQS